MTIILILFIVFCFCRKPNPLISFPTYPNGGLHGICNEFPFRFRTWAHCAGTPFLRSASDSGSSFHFRLPLSFREDTGRRFLVWSRIGFRPLLFLWQSWGSYWYFLCRKRLWWRFIWRIQGVPQAFCTRFSRKDSSPAYSPHDCSAPLDSPSDWSQSRTLAKEAPMLMSSSS